MPKRKPAYSIEPRGNRWILLDESGQEVGNYASGEEAIERAQQRNQVAELLHASGSVAKTTFAETAKHLSDAGRLKLGEVSKSHRGKKKGIATGGQLPGVPLLPTDKPAPNPVAAAGRVLEDPDPGLNARQISKMLAGVEPRAGTSGKAVRTAAETPRGSKAGQTTKRQQRGEPSLKELKRDLLKAMADLLRSDGTKAQSAKHFRPSDFSPGVRTVKPVKKDVSVEPAEKPPPLRPSTPAQSPPQAPRKPTRPAATPPIKDTAPWITPKPDLTAGHSTVTPRLPDVPPAMPSASGRPAVRSKTPQELRESRAARRNAPPSVPTPAPGAAYWAKRGLVPAEVVPERKRGGRASDAAKFAQMSGQKTPNMRDAWKLPEKGSPFAWSPNRPPIGGAPGAGGKSGAGLDKLTGALHALVALLRGDLHGALKGVAHAFEHGQHPQGGGAGMGRGAPQVPGRGTPFGPSAGGGGRRRGGGGPPVATGGGGFPGRPPGGKGGPPGAGIGAMFGNIASKAGGVGAAGAVAGMAGANTGGTIGAMAGFAVGGPAGALVGAAIGELGQAAVETTVAIAKIPSKIDAWGQSLIDSQKDIRMFSGQISNTFAKLRRQEIQLGARTAAQTGGSTERLGEGLMELREALQPFRAMATNFSNSIGGAAASGTAKIVKGVEKAIKDANALQLIQMGPILGPLAAVLQMQLKAQDAAKRAMTNTWRTAWKQAMSHPFNTKP